MCISDRTFFRYLPVSERDRQWGLYLSGIGSAVVPPNHPNYPPSVHPRGYMYSWEQGRVLHEYQVLYLLRGGGQFESASTGKRELTAGTLFLLFPGEWHRYRPDPATGWEEYWVSFGGRAMDELVVSKFFLPSEPIIRIGADEAILHCYHELLSRARSMGEPGIQPLGAADVWRILAGALVAVQRVGIPARANEIIHRAKTILEDRVEGTLTMAELARLVHMGEDQFRRLFKKHSGMGPLRYYLELKMQRARQLLRETDLSVKQISRLLGFATPFHFSKVFKQRNGKSPSEWREGGAKAVETKQEE